MLVCFEEFDVNFGVILRLKNEPGTMSGVILIVTLFLSETTMNDTQAILITALPSKVLNQSSNYELQLTHPKRFTVCNCCLFISSLHI